MLASLEITVFIDNKIKVLSVCLKTRLGCNNGGSLAECLSIGGFRLC